MEREKERILDAYLVASARVGDRQALELLVRRWNGKLVAHAWRLLRGGEAAKDTVQEGWAEMLRGLSRLRDDDAFPAWAYRIVSRRCARHIGRLRGDRRLAEEIAAHPAEERIAEPASLDVEAVRRAIRALLPSFHWLEEKAGPAGFALRCNSFAVIRSVIADGIAISTMPCVVGERDPELARCFPPERLLDVPLYLAARRDALRRPAVRDLFESIAKHVESNADLLAGRTEPLS